MESLSSKQKKFLKGIAHHMRALMQVGRNGVTDAALKELDQVLTNHELVKVKITCEGQQEFRDIVSEIETKVKAELVHKVGHTALFFRPNPEDPKFDLTDG